MVVVHLALLQIDGHLVIGTFAGPPHQFRDFVVFQNYVQESVLRAVVGEDVGERRSDDGAKTEIGERPDRMLARGSATEILPGQQNARLLVTRIVEHKRLCTRRGLSPVVKKKLPKPRALNALQKLLGNDLIGVDIHPIERRNAAFVYTKWFHGVFATSLPTETSTSEYP